MKYLLDTGVWLWSLWEPERISPPAKGIMGDVNQEIFLSAVTSCEIAIKAAVGKLRLPEPPASFVPRRMTEQGLRPLPISHQHALAIFGLPPHHRDPFDRLLVAQATVENLVLITADAMLERYPVEVLWAGR